MSKKEEVEDEEMPDLAEAGEEEVDEEDDGKDEGDDKGNKQSRNEKKARKALSKVGLKPIGPVSKVTVKKSKQILFVLHKPEVFKGPGDNYVIYGEAKVGDDGSAAGGGAADMFSSARAPDASRSAPRISASASSNSSAAAEEDEAVDETGIEAKDLELVMSQAGVSRGAAAKALKKSNNDIVTAIMELTLGSS